MIVADVLGNEKEVSRTYEDGSYSCPFCTYPVCVPKVACENPWCVANPDMPPDRARDIYEDRRKKAEEEERRRQNEEWSREYRRQQKEKEQAWAAEQLAECERRGACRACLFQGYQRAKFVKHRGRCPKERK